jgi:outer membrane protein assembly factor BamB
MKNLHPHKIKTNSIRKILPISLLLFFGSWGTAWGEDWPTYKHDNHRSGVSGESLAFPLEKVWSRTSLTPPQTAWPGPAQWDSFANLIDLKSMRDFDPVYYTTVIGDRVFWGSSVDDSVHCANLSDGEEQWTFCTSGPVRVPPAGYNNKVYFGSDDGFVYCLNAENGELVWSCKPSPGADLIPCDGKLISPWPCRTGVFVQNGIAYFAASLLPWKESYLCAVNAETGVDKGDGLFAVKHAQSTMQGAILASSTRLYLSHGRQQPQVYDLKTGYRIGAIGKSGDGGCFALLTPDDVLIHGAGQNHGAKGELRGFNAATDDRLATFPMANCMVIQDRMAYLHSNGWLSAFDREMNMGLQSQKVKIESKVETLKKKFKKLDDPKGESEEGKKLLQQIEASQDEIKQLEEQIPASLAWKREVPFYHSLILAGDILIAGGKNLVAAHKASTGELVWSQTVEGNVHGLTVASGRLLVSADRGEIICFSPKK